MNRASWTFALTLALPPLAVAGCKDSNQKYIAFDAASDAPAGDAKSDVSVDAPRSDANRNDTADDTVASDVPPTADAGAVTDGNSDVSSDTVPDTDVPDSAISDAEPGQ
jgi:hypothetical protein